MTMIRRRTIKNDKNKNSNNNKKSNNQKRRLTMTMIAVSSILASFGSKCKDKWFELGFIVSRSILQTLLLCWFEMLLMVVNTVAILLIARLARAIVACICQ